MLSMPTDASQQRVIDLSSRNITNKKVFIDTVIRNTSLAMDVVTDDSDDDESDVESEGGDDVEWDSANESVSDDDDKHKTPMPEIENLEISYNKEFLSHDTGNTDDLESTSTELVEMDISACSSSLEPATIECNIPASSIEGASPPTRLLAHGYEDTLSNGFEKELHFVNDLKFVCSLSKIKKLFSYCMDSDCNMPMVEAKEKFIGCTLEVRWQCKAGHCGCWQSSEVVNNIYVNNVQAASALLFTGNNFTKVSLFAKCLRLAFFSSSTYYKYQKNYLAKPVHDWWNAMQGLMFDMIGNQPVVVTGDGQMDSPGFSAKNCIYTIMHADLHYVLQVEVVDVRHSQLKSTVMEKVGCERALDGLMEKLEIAEFVTDASSQIIKMLGNYTFQLFVINKMQDHMRMGIYVQVLHASFTYSLESPNEN